MKSWIKNLKTKKFGAGTYSQSYQDELIDEIFKAIGTRNSRPFCVEFGFNTNTLTSGSGANVAKLIKEHNWNHLLLDGRFSNPEINLHQHFLTPENICDVFKKYRVPKEPEYISIDVDSTDLWLFKSVITEYRAMLFSVEYNSHYPIDKAITFPNNPNETWENDRGYGASLKALTMVAEDNQYSLLWVVPMYDAFFIRNDLIDDGSSELCFPFKSWKNATELVSHRALNNAKRSKLFLDYETYSSSGGDLKLSQKAANKTCLKYLCDKSLKLEIQKFRRRAWNLWKRNIIKT